MFYGCLFNLLIQASWIKKFNEPKLGKFEVSPNNFNDVMMMSSPRFQPIFCQSTSFRGVTNYMTSARIVTMPFKGGDVYFDTLI